MLLFLKRTVSAKPAVFRRSKNSISANTLLLASSMIGMLSLSACQTAPNTPTAMKTTTIQTVPSSQQPKATITTVTQAPIVHTDIVTADNDYPIEPYRQPESTESTNPLTQETPVFTPSNPVLTQSEPVIIIPSRDDYMISEPSAPSHNELLEQARRNSQQQSQQPATNNSDLPAFRNLMQTGISQLKSGKLTNAENSFTRAQRLAPKSSAVYFYLAQVALKKKQPRKAEAMARRGLSVSQDANRRRALWQIILQSGQAQGNSRVISEAKRALR